MPTVWHAGLCIEIQCEVHIPAGKQGNAIVPIFPSLITCRRPPKWNSKIQRLLCMRLMNIHSPSVTDQSCA